MQVANATNIKGLGGPAPGAVVLQAAINVVRMRVIHSDMIELSQRQVLDKAPGIAAIAGDGYAAIVAGNHVPGIGRVDPPGMGVDMNRLPRRAAVNGSKVVERPATINGTTHAAFHVVHRIGVLGIDIQQRVIKGPHRHVGVFIDGLPADTAVVGTHEGRGFGLNKGIHTVRIARRDGKHGAPQVTFGEAVLGRQGAPGVAAVNGAEQPRAGPPALETVRPAAKLPERRKQLLRVARVHLDVSGTGALIGTGEDVGPGLAAVGGPEYTAVAAITPQRPQHRHIGNIGITGVQRNAVDSFGAIETELDPAAPAIGRAVHAVTDGCRVACCPFTGTHPDYVGVSLVYRHRADRVHRLIIEQRRPGQARII